MSVVVVGLNHRTVPLGLLERMTVPPARVPKALADLSGRDHIAEAVVLSTCHRTEVYAVAEKFHGAVSDIRNFLGELAFAPPEEFSDHLYTYYDEAAVAHLFGVAAGLDSVVLGESEILGQVKSAWEAAREEQTCGATLSAVFRHALEAGKRARTETGIARHITSVPQAAVAMATERLGSLAGTRVLVLGAGEMGEALAVALAGAGVAEILVANRSAPRARAVAKRVGGRAVSLFELPDALAAADVLLTSTGATTPVVDAEDVAPVLGGRADRPLLIVDVAMPRDVDESVAGLDGVTLLDLEDLKRFAEAGLDERRREVAAVRSIIGDEVSRYADRATERQVAPAVSALRDRADAVRVAELERYRARLAGLDDRQRDAVEALTRGIVAKLLHEPTVRLKDAAGGPKGERLAEALCDLFGL
ncbi:MAG: glutamyl-tRNA reductase [Acidimicrobiales bacterium]|nr:glutamyl-tRNA reductase [Acidimicrobiales bacterium]